MNKIICGICKKEIKGLAVLSPTLNESERCMCPSCFKKKYPVNKKELAKMIGDDEWMSFLKKEC